MEDQRFVYITYINTSPDKLWRALTSAEFTRKYWSGVDLESDWTVGSPVYLKMNGKIADDGTVLKFDPPKLLSYTFHPLHSEEMRLEQPSRVSFEIEALGPDTKPKGTGLKLTVIHEDFAPNSVVYPAICQGWPGILSSLKTLLETGQALEIG